MTAVQVKLTGGEAARLRAKGTENIRAYDKYMKALKCLQNITREEVHQARKELDEVISLDPNWSSPYTFQAWSHIMDVWNQWGASPLQSMQQAEALAQKAVSLDEENALAHTMLCNVYLMKRQHKKAVAEGMRAVELGPNLSQAHFSLGRALNFAGRPEEAIAYLQTAMRLDPVPDPRPYLQLGVAYRDLGQYEKAIRSCKKGLSITPDDLWLHFTLASIYSLTGHEEEASAEIAEVLRINPMFSLDRYSRLVPYKDQADVDRIVNALRKAG
jgi:adenylate cyclase